MGLQKEDSKVTRETEAARLKQKTVFDETLTLLESLSWLGSSREQEDGAPSLWYKMLKPNHKCLEYHQMQSNLIVCLQSLSKPWEERASTS